MNLGSAPLRVNLPLVFAMVHHVDYLGFFLQLRLELRQVFPVKVVDADIREFGARRHACISTEHTGNASPVFADNVRQCHDGPGLVLHPESKLNASLPKAAQSIQYHEQVVPGDDADHLPLIIDHRYAGDPFLHEQFRRLLNGRIDPNHKRVPGHDVSNFDLGDEMEQLVHFQGGGFRSRGPFKIRIRDHAHELAALNDRQHADLFLFHDVNHLLHGVFGGYGDDIWGHPVLDQHSSASLTTCPRKRCPRRPCQYYGDQRQAM